MSAEKNPGGELTGGSLPVRIVFTVEGKSEVSILFSFVGITIHRFELTYNPNDSFFQLCQTFESGYAKRFVIQGEHKLKHIVRFLRNHLRYYVWEFDLNKKRKSLHHPLAKLFQNRHAATCHFMDDLIAELKEWCLITSDAQFFEKE